MSELRGAVNNVASMVAVCEPWTFVPTVPEEVKTSKEKFAAWRLQPATEHLVYTGTEALNPNVRASKQNPVCKLHAFIADYDFRVSQEQFDTILTRVQADLRPTWASWTFSGGTRIIWMFEAPLALEQGHLAKEFLKVAQAALKVNKAMGGFDEPAFHDLTKLYDVGSKWKKLGDYAIPTNMLHYWLTEAAKKTKWDRIGEVIIPIEAVAAEVEVQFPGRWEGEFEVGKRGVAFWESGATNPTSAIITEAGMIAFSTEQIFHPWSKILGGSFVRKFQSDKIGAAVADTWWDGKYYYMKSSYGVLEPHYKEDYSARLRVKFGIDANKGRENASEMDMALVYIQEHRRVTGVLPKLFDKEEIIYSNGKRFLNNACVVPVAPAALPQEWGVNFPWLAEFFDTCFDATLVPCIDYRKLPMPAKLIFLAWWKRFYCSALGGSLTKGQSMWLAGGVDRGKTLLSNQIVGRSVGGSADASDFLNHSTSFNKELLEVALWCIDDGTASQDVQAHLKFTEMVKRAVANPVFNYHAKFHDMMRVMWYGRVLVTLNDDASSIRILPNLDTSIEDKIIVLLFSEAKRVFPDWNEIDDILTTELPYLLRWLIDWKVPQELIGNKRFGVNSYIDESLRVKSLNAGGVSDLLELVELWIQRGGEALLKTHGSFWEGTATAWMAAVNAEDTLRPMISKFTARALGRKFVEASRIRNSRIQIANIKGHGNLYRISLVKNEDDVKRTVVCEPQLLA